MTTSSMRRRDALFVAGATIGAAALQACTASLGPLSPEQARRSVARGDERDPLPHDAPPVIGALTLGLHAPSPHNGQAWKFRLVSDREALFFVDAGRLLPRTDPPGRQVHLGCGCFAEAFALGALRLGYVPEVELFPQGPYRDPDDVGRRPVARLSLAGSLSASERDPLCDWIEARQTSRLPFTGETFMERDLGPVLEGARLRRSRVTLVPSASMREYISLFDAAMAKEANTRATNEETRRWFRFDDDALATKRDGFGFAANGVTGLMGTLARWFTSDTEASWNAPGTIEKGLAAFREASSTARGILLVSTDENSHAEQVEAGRDVYRLLLSLTKQGFASQPMNQVIQEYEEMRALRERFEALSGIAAPRKVQMILRVGRSAVPWRSYRRRLSSLLV